MNAVSSLARRASLPRAAAVVAALFVSALWFRVHSWESYMYAASAEGFFHMADMFSAAHRGEEVPDLSLFHPYHPLFHMLVGVLLRGAAIVGRLFSGAGGEVGALAVAVVINKLSGLAAALLAFRILRRLLDDATSATLATAGMFCTKAFLFGTFSGDAHVLSLALFLGALDLVLSAHHTPATDARRAALAALLFSLGAGMNLAIFFYGLAPLAVLVAGRRFYAVLVAVAVSAFLLFGIYVVTPVLLFDLDSLAAYTRLFGLYAFLPPADSSLSWLLFAFVDAVAAGMVGGIDLVSAAARVVIGVLLVGGALAMWRAPRGTTARFWVPMWIVGFALGELLMHTVTSVNGTVYVMLPLFALMGFLLRALSGRRVWFLSVVALLVAVSALNVGKVVLTKAFAGQEALPRMAALRSPPPPDTPIGLRLSHMSLFQEVYYLGHERGFTTMKAFIPMVPESEAAFDEWAAAQRRYCELSAAPDDRAGLRNRLRARSVLSPDLYHFSVNHPQSKGMIVKHVSFACR